MQGGDKSDDGLQLLLSSNPFFVSPAPAQCSAETGLTLPGLFFMSGPITGIIQFNVLH